ncbi:MAG: dimethylsulfonioproprionate lyase family protein, partial [Alphaproteobacteria bacterium]
MTIEADDQQLSDIPDWRYLLREYYEFYRYLSSGGSPKIRSHQRAVREAISRVMAANTPVKRLERADKPVTVHLKRALDEGLLERHASFIRAIQTIKHDLCWQYGYDRMPRGLERKFAYAEFTGPSGPVVTEEVILGIVLFAPGCTYPAHAHGGFQFEAQRY